MIHILGNDLVKRATELTLCRVASKYKSCARTCKKVALGIMLFQQISEEKKKF